MNYLDRNAIVNARLNGLNDELGLEGNQYNTLSEFCHLGVNRFHFRLTHIYSQHPLCRLLARPNPKQHGSHQNQTVVIYRGVLWYLGPRLALDISGQ